MSQRPSHPPFDPARRAFLARSASWSLLSTLGAAGFFPTALGAEDPAAPRQPHFAAKAKRVLFLFMNGGPSQVDTFDYRPELQRNDGKSVDLEVRRNKFESCTILGSKRTFAQHGATGQWCSDVFPHLAKHLDKLAIVKSLYTDSFAHGSALLQMNSGQFLTGHPAMGSWIHYGLGSENRDLPGFVVMQDPRGGPISGAANWSAGYMPASHQGSLFRAAGDPLLDLAPAPNNPRASMNAAAQAEQITALNGLNSIHQRDRASDSRLTARMASYDLATRMQSAAAEALRIDAESEATRRMYGLDAPKPNHSIALGPAPFGRQCLIARRLLERDVRFVQIYHGGGHQQQTWDGHADIEENLRIHCPEVDQPIAALLEDLDRTGLLKDTLVIWGGEFGRQPVSQQAVAGQLAATGGRDHNPQGFTMWLAGAGIKPGSYGETDELGYKAVVNRHHVRDLHATVLHLLGLDHETLTYPYGGLDRKLTGVVEAHPIDAILA
jgi:Protein of unknown function (DUF1501)